MPMNREQKATLQAALAERFQRASSFVLVDFRGIDVPSITDLRGRFAGVEVDYAVVRNNICLRALKDIESVDADALAPHLVGPTAVAWSYEDPSAAAKVIKAFRKDAGDVGEKLVVKCGMLDGQLLDAAAVESQLATLPGKDELRAQLLAQLLAPAQQLVRQLAAPAQNFAYALDARKRQQEGA